MQKKYLPRLFIFLVLISSIVLQSSAQVTYQEKKQAQKQLKRGDRYYAEEDYHKALHHYKQVLETDPENARALYQTGITTLLIYSNKQSLDLLLKYGESAVAASLDKHYYYWLGRAYHANAQFEKAEEAYKKYADVLPKSDSRQEEVQRLIMQVQSGKVLAEQAVDYYALSLGSPLNSRYSDHSPMLTNNRKTLIFTSRRTEDKQGEEITPKGDAFENIYTSDYVNGTWEKPKLIGNGFNTRKQHTSNVQLFDNETKMLVYKSVNFGSLFIAEKKNGRWINPRKFSKSTSSGQFIPNGFVTRDGKSVYFASSQGCFLPYCRQYLV
jgi:hypothetical protein